MRRILCVLVFWLTAAPCLAEIDLGFPAVAQHEVIVPDRTPDPGARLYAPEGAGPFPAVVLSHASGQLRQNIYRWAKRFFDAGYAVLIVDHLSPRGRRDNLDFGISVTDYARDDIAAMKYLRGLPYVDGKRIAQMGFSYGAMAGLREASAKFRDKNLGGEAFAAIVSVYPWCNQQGGRVYQDHQWNFYDDTDTPLLVIVGLDDDEALPGSCIERARQNAAKGLPVELRELPGTTHAFDLSWLGDKPAVVRTEFYTRTYRYSPQAVETTWNAAAEFLARRLKLPIK